MSDSSFGKVLFSVTVGTAIGATLGLLFAPAKGAVTRRVLARSSRRVRRNASEKLEDLVDSANEIIEEIKETTSEYLKKGKHEVDELIDED